MDLLYLALRFRISSFLFKFYLSHSRLLFNDSALSSFETAYSKCNVGGPAGRFDYGNQDYKAYCIVLLRHGSYFNEERPVS